MKKPEQLQNANLTQLRKICQDYLDFVDNDKEYSEDNDFNEYIFETAMQTFFGDKVFDYINKRQQ